MTDSNVLPEDRPTQRAGALDTRITPGEEPGLERDDQGHPVIGPKTTLVQMADEWRRLALEATDTANECLQARLETNLELKSIRSLMQLGTRPIAYYIMVAVVIAMAVSQVYVFHELSRLTDLIDTLQRHLSP